MNFPVKFSAFVLAALVALPATAETFRSNGDYLSFSQYDGTNYVYLYATSATTTTGPQGYLSYSVARCNPWGCEQLAAGYGTLPAGALTVNQQGDATLAIADVAQLPNFYRYGASTAGPINVSATRTGAFTYSNRGTQRLTTPTLRVLSNGSWDYGAATATGSLLGRALSGSVGAETGNSKNVTVQIERN